jgi:hypothetical protein
VHLGKHIRRASSLAACLLLASCASGEGPVSVDSSWNLTCPVDSAVGCGSFAESTCLGDFGHRTVVGARGERACNDETMTVSCQAIDRPNNVRTIFLEASVGNDFAFELRGATLDGGNGSVDPVGCTVTIVEDGLAYDVGDCGPEPPSIAQPCQLTNVVTESGEVSFDLQCRALISSLTGNAFDVGALDGGPTTISFSNCSGI